MEGDFEGLDDCFEDVFENEIYARERFRFPLLDLPPELLIRICELAVARKTTIDATLAPKAKNQADILQQPSITRTCRLLRRESLRAFYRDNDFEAFHWARHACIREWLIAIGPDNLKAMQTLTFHCKFNTEFWENKFQEIGIKTKCEEANDQTCKLTKTCASESIDTIQLLLDTNLLSAIELFSSVQSTVWQRFGRGTRIRRVSNEVLRRDQSLETVPAKAELNEQSPDLT